VEPNDNTRWFSIVYLFIGASAVATALAIFAQSILDQNKEWFTLARKKEKYLRLRSHTSVLVRTFSFFKFHIAKVRSICLWCLWVVGGTLFGVYSLDLTFTQGLYFSLCTLSGGGQVSIPADSPGWKYGLSKCRAPRSLLIYVHY
jgi:hypothetical protein